MNASLEIRIHVRLMLVISREAGHSGSYLLGELLAARGMAHACSVADRKPRQV